MNEFLLFLSTNAMPAVADHLWQSTVFAAAAWLTTLAMRERPAGVRHALWMAASVKFLVPFSLLVGLGGLFSGLQHAPEGREPVLFTVVNSAVQPFSENVLASFPVAQQASLEGRLDHWGYLTLALLWLVGVAAVLMLWYARWRKISAALKGAEPVNSGREVEILRRLARRDDIGSGLTLLRSRVTMEPGVFGVLRPVLIWPERLSELLNDEQLEAILAHEAMHVRRRDNLTAAIHMAVEAVFWFHPMVWWMGRRMIEERERACDEAVMQLGSDRAIYAESLLKACRFCVEPPLACVAGISGADLNQRIRSIMKPRIEELTATGKLALALLASVAFTGPVAYGIVHRVPVYEQLLITSGPRPSFAVATIKPAKPDELRLGGMAKGSLNEQHASLYDLVVSAYNMRREGPLMGGPAWRDTKFFDVQAKWEDAQTEAAKGLSVMQMLKQNQLMLQSLLAERFQLKVHTVIQEREVYALVVAKGGPKFKEVEAPAALGAGETPAGVVMPPPPPPPAPTNGNETAGPEKVVCIGICYTASHQVTGKGAPMGMLVGWISTLPEMDRMVVDETGLHGKYDFVLNGVSDGPGPPPNAGESQQEAPLSLFTALPEQLGLRLKLKKIPVQVLVIDHAELPSAN